jgi:hypothetical protein
MLPLGLWTPGVKRMQRRPPGRALLPLLRGRTPSEDRRSASLPQLGPPRPRGGPSWGFGSHAQSKTIRSAPVIGPPILPLMPNLEHEGHDVRRGRKRMLARPALLRLETIKADAPIPSQPEIELASRDAEKATCLTDVLGDLLVVLYPPQPDLRPSKLFLFPLCLSHAGLLAREIQPVHGISY